MKLTAKTIGGIRLPAGKTDHIEWDDDLPGFGLRLRGSGDRSRKTWVAQYRAQGRTRRMRIGAVEKLSSDEARKAAKKVLARVALGRDPQARTPPAARRSSAPWGRWSPAISRPSSRSCAEYLPRVGALPHRAAFQAAARHADRSDHPPGCRGPGHQDRRREGGIAAASARRAQRALSWASVTDLPRANPVVGTHKPQEAMPR